MVRVRVLEIFVIQKVTFVLVNLNLRAMNNYLLFSQNKKEMKVFLNMNLFMNEERRWEKIYINLTLTIRLCLCLKVTSRHSLFRESRNQISWAQTIALSFSMLFW